MKPVVIDASVVAEAIFGDALAAEARALLESGRPLRAPSLIHSEVANVIWKRVMRGEITRDEAAELLADVTILPIQTVASVELLDSALELAIFSRRTVYDSLYLALATRLKTILFTGDRRLVNALAATPLAPHIRWIGQPKSGAAQR